ncbi:hypothetical protein OEZ85_007215 [Tetradesmus obliquus]|uniref:Uncharacterized protein n=1 Tax=Tetradesmus obliquus TaxID=3088 RepID=A0ABY8U1U2_TETOB|nr:hypothetical protein OEZ85_007215 [Tetradesmus obliquus]
MSEKNVDSSAGILQPFEKSLSRAKVAQKHLNEVSGSSCSRHARKGTGRGSLPLPGAGSMLASKSSPEPS